MCPNSSAMDPSSSSRSTPSSSSFILGPLPVINNPSGTRRRSVDTGGLSLALKDRQSGKGWGGWDDNKEVSIPSVCSVHLVFSQY